MEKKRPMCPLLCLVEQNRIEIQASQQKQTKSRLASKNRNRNRNVRAETGDSNWVIGLGRNTASTIMIVLNKPRVC